MGFQDGEEKMELLTKRSQMGKKELEGIRSDGCEGWAFWEIAVDFLEDL